MNNLFSIFDPSSYLGVPINWVSLFFPVLAVFPGYWMSGGQMRAAQFTGLNWISGELKAVFGPSLRPGTSFIMVGMFTYIFFLNMMSMVPYVFTPTGHLVISLSLGLPLWVGHVMLGGVMVPENFFSHLVPMGTPPILMPFMVVIEIISSVIRPLTLGVRLAANLVAGHLLLTLLGGGMSQFTLVSPALAVGGLAVVLLLVLELAVSVIQAYVFSLLSSLYVAEVSAAV